MSRKDAQPDPEAGAGYGSIEPEPRTEPRTLRRRVVLAAAVALMVVFAAAGLTQTANITANTIETPYVLSEFPPAPSWGACGGLSNLCYQDRACTGCAEPGYTCVRGNEWYWQCRDDTPSDQQRLIFAGKQLEDSRDARGASSMTNLAQSIADGEEPDKRTMMTSDGYFGDVVRLPKSWSVEDLGKFAGATTTSLWRKLANFIYIGPQQQSNPDGGGPGCMLYPLKDCATQPTTREAVTASATMTGGGTGDLSRLCS